MLRKTLASLGTLLILAALVIIVLVTRTGDPARTPRPAAQAALAQQVPAVAPARHQMVPRAQAVGNGRALATMTIPRFGAHWRWQVAQGVTPDVLAGGPGHYPGTALPGARGNSAFAGHRAGHGDPFIDFDRLRPGDRVTLAQHGAAWTYQVTTHPRIIDLHDVWVLHRLPGRMLTLTTCWPRYGSSRRMFVRGELVRVDGEHAGHWRPVWPARRAAARG